MSCSTFEEHQKEGQQLTLLQLPIEGFMCKKRFLRFFLYCLKSHFFCVCVYSREYQSISLWVVVIRFKNHVFIVHSREYRSNWCWFFHLRMAFSFGFVVGLLNESADYLLNRSIKCLKDQKPVCALSVWFLLFCF